MDTAKWQSIKGVMSAMLDLPASERAAALEREPDAEIRREVELLLAAHDSSDRFIERPFLIEHGIAPDETANKMIGQQIEDYLIIDRIGTGGMGAVFLARRLHSDFTQKVALKLIKRGMDSEAILKRFATERRILSTLKHQNIAALVDGGISSEGLPFFVMEYVDGKPLNQFCRESDLSLDERLELFYKICSAVEHAHRNLIVHRDLKPSNILVAEDGTPKLLDFGIAKLLTDDGSATAETLTQGKIFTPEYASPEQILGKPVSTSTDVYSLGVILYELLVDHRPFDVKGKSFDEIVEGICRTESPKPSDTAEQPHVTVDDATGARPIPRANLRGDIDNIVLKALRKDPAERYGSVQEFSADIRRYLSGMTVMARPQTLGYQFGKYVRRHKAAVSAAALVVISLVAGASIATWQAVIAQRERAKAERRFSDVRILANSLVFEFNESLRNLPGSTPARELLVGRALEYLDKLAAENVTDPALQLELADAYDKIAEIQGGFRTSNLGYRQKAEESIRKALLIREALAAGQPSNAAFRRGLAASYANLSDALWIQVLPPESLAMSQRALAIRLELAAELPNDPETQLAFVATQRRTGYLLAANDRFEEGIELIDQAISKLEALTSADPENEAVLGQLGTAYYHKGTLIDRMRPDLPTTLKYFKKAEEIRGKLLAKEPTNAGRLRDFAAMYYETAEVLEKQGDIRSAMANSVKARDIFAKLLDDDPRNQEVRQSLAAIGTQEAGLLIKTGKVSEAIPILNGSLDALKKLREASPNDDIVQYRIATANAILGNGYMALAMERSAGRAASLENWRVARTYFQASYEIYRSFRDTGKSVGTDASVVDKIGAEIAKCDAALGRSG